MPNVMKSGSLKLLEPSGLHLALPLPLLLLDTIDWSASRPGRFTRRKRHRTHRIGRRLSLEPVWTVCPYWKWMSNPRHTRYLCYCPLSPRVLEYSADWWAGEGHQHSQTAYHTPTVSYCPLSEDRREQKDSN